MPAETNEPPKADFDRRSLTSRDRALSDRFAKQELVDREIKALRILLLALVERQPQNGRDLTTAIQTLSRAIYLHSTQAAETEDDPFDVAAPDEQARLALVQELQ
ncbi:MAG TPA: hypothetical protein DEV93_13105 [Chloroflexi bacterium]|nr:hypothetical protein [Chloroflexota bacterium]